MKMLQANHRIHNEPLLKSWEEFVQRFFIEKKSYVVPSNTEKILTRENVDKVLELFNSKGEIYKEIKKGFDDATDAEKLILLHAEWIHLLVFSEREKQIETKQKSLTHWGE